MRKNVNVIHNKFSKKNSKLEIMKGTKELHFDYLCRTCMHEVVESDAHAATTALPVEQPERKWQSIFDTIDECPSVCISDLLSSTIPQIEVNVSDKLPKIICRECLEQLQNIYRFQQMCIQSDNQLRELIAERCGNIKVMISATSLEDEISTKAFPFQEPIIGAGEDKIVEHINTLTEKPQANVNDPLQNVDATNKNFKNTQVDVSACLKLELGDDDDGRSNADYNDYEITAYSMDASLKLERMTPKSGEEITAIIDESNSEAQSDWVKNPSKTRGVKRVSKSKTPTVKTGSKAKKLDNARNGQMNLASSTHSCSLCNKSFNSRRYLLRHLRRHKKWDELKNMPSQPDTAAKHIRFKCDICERHYNKPESLHLHRLTHDEKVDGNKLTNYACNICEKVYGSQRTLTRHKRQRHCTIDSPQEASKLYTCEFCNKSFQQSGTLKDHLRTHTGEQPYLCSECGKAFNSSSNMKQHLLRHTGVRRYECPDCPKKFPCLSDLASHKAVHRRIKPHICDICGGAFGKPYQLKKHKMYHNGEKPYKCEYCEMRFVCMDHQRRHMRTHTGEKPYKCKYCERAFAQSNDLIKHLRTHLGDNVYKCELCPSAFRLATELRVHFSVHKNEDSETRERNMKALMEEESRLRLNLSSKKIKRLSFEQSQQKAEAKVITVELDE